MVLILMPQHFTAQSYPCFLKGKSQHHLWVFVNKCAEDGSLDA